MKTKERVIIKFKNLDLAYKVINIALKDFDLLNYNLKNDETVKEKLKNFKEAQTKKKIFRKSFSLFVFLIFINIILLSLMFYFGYVESLFSGKILILPILSSVLLCMYYAKGRKSKRTNIINSGYSKKDVVVIFYLKQERRISFLNYIQSEYSNKTKIYSFL